MANSKHKSSFSTCKQINHNSNSSHFVAIFDCFHNMRSNMELCDITLTAGNVSFSAHRLILAGNSPYFRNMFVSENADSRQEEVVLPSNCRGDTLRAILDYFYSGKLSINQEDCEDLLSLASLLQVCYNFSSIQSIVFSICISKCFFDEYITPDHDFHQQQRQSGLSNSRENLLDFILLFNTELKIKQEKICSGQLGKKAFFLP